MRIALHPTLPGTPRQRANQTRNMIMEAKTPLPSAAEKMKTVKATWDKASAGPKKDAALKHYKAAEKAQTAKDDALCIRELDAAVHALA